MIMEENNKKVRVPFFVPENNFYLCKYEKAKY